MKRKRKKARKKKTKKQMEIKRLMNKANKLAKETLG